MSGDAPQDELRSELAEVDKDLADLRRNAAQIRAGIGDAEDPADRGALIHEADEQDNLAEQLAVRREALLRRLSGA
jgi:hypothetical protein